jgi:hypothetical protein
MYKSSRTNICSKYLPPYLQHETRTLYTTILCEEMLNYSHNCINVGYSTITKLLLINVWGLDRVFTALSIREHNISQFCQFLICKMCHFEYYSYYYFRKFTKITDKGKTTGTMDYFIAFFQLQLRKNNGKRLGT